MEDTGRTCSTQSTKQGSVRQQAQVQHGSALGLLHIYYDFKLGFHVRLLTSGWMLSLNLFVCSGFSFLLLCCHIQLQYLDFCFLLLYLVLSCVNVISWRATLFRRGNRGGVNQGSCEVRDWELRREWKLWLCVI